MPTGKYTRIIIPVQERFEEKWMPEPNTGCWLWIGRTRIGYGRFDIGDKVIYAHRLAWELYRGPIPEGLHVCHDCDTPCCVNPDHLFLGTQKDNMQDKIKKGRGNYAIFYGAENPFSKLTSEDIIQIRKAPRRYKPIADTYGISASHVSNIKHLRIWKHLSSP
jgi:hypothetical protein